mmetsp:Transcript_114125/g.219620  ORF Transcript_114125/g.219620 Transcript_114125/m.219620 type:complete len:113 (+) Transcript_114125:3-341(+)
MTHTAAAFNHPCTGGMRQHECFRDDCSLLLSSWQKDCFVAGHFIAANWTSSISVQSLTNAIRAKLSMATGFNDGIDIGTHANNTLWTCPHCLIRHSHGQHWWLQHLSYSGWL